MKQHKPFVIEMTKAIEPKKIKESKIFEKNKIKTLPNKKKSTEKSK
tara:strand:- start:1251 stop:1388 length:138 start_codon:yes stop_codon:yes gene_type:complete